MNVSIDTLFGIHEKALNTRIKKSALIANNIANSETPGFKARDLDFKAIIKRAVANDDQSVTNSNQLHTTHLHHQANIFVESHFSDLKYRQPTHPSLDGNTVDTHLEKSAYLDNVMRMQASLRFLNGRISGLMNALRGES